MPLKKHGRQYDLVVFGATGYTGALVAEHVAQYLPADLSWAVAGRSSTKLQQIVDQCRAIDPTRKQPEIEVCQLADADLTTLAQKTFFLISTVGPYARFGEHAFKACAESGTHYVDATAEVPWTRRMIEKYEATAKATGACMFPQCAMESAPSDLLCWKVVAAVRDSHSVGTADVIMDMHTLDSKPSGGTLNTLLNLFDQFSLGEILASLEPYALSPLPNAHKPPKSSVVTGTIHHHGLGVLCTSPTGMANRAIVHRTWGLAKQNPALGKEYGGKFTYSEYMHASGRLTGMAIHYTLLFGSLFILLPPVRGLIKRLTYAPGQGPDKELAKKETVEFRALAKPDSAKSTHSVLGFMTYTGSMYYLTGALLAQAANTLLQDDIPGLAGGIYTPACLGQPYIDRLEKVGFTFSTKTLD